MERRCVLLDRCGFFRKYQTSKNLACKGFITNYCTGSKMEECGRKAYRDKHGAPPPDDMMPSGKMIAAK